MILHPILRRPSGHLTGPGFACGPGGCRDVSHIPMPVWQPTPQGARLRALRLGPPHLGLLDMARRIGIKPSELSALEHGKWDLIAEEWDAVLDRALAPGEGEEVGRG